MEKNILDAHQYIPVVPAAQTAPLFGVIPNETCKQKMQGVASLKLDHPAVHFFIVRCRDDPDPEVKAWVTEKGHEIATNPQLLSSMSQRQRSGPVLKSMTEAAELRKVLYPDPPR